MIEGLAFPVWTNYVVALAVYFAIFFIAVDYPYYLGAEKEKKIKLSAEEKVRESLLQKLCIGELSETGLSERIAIELNISRIDRQIDNIKSEPSHPYSIIKPVSGFVIVSILANIFVEVILKLGLHLS
jgi:hypothetical protein